MTHEIITGDCIEVMRGMEAESAQCVVTSPPYWGLRDYGQDGQIGLESTLEEYVAKMVDVFCEVRRVLRDDGTVWLNLGDSYASGHSECAQLPSDSPRRPMVRKPGAKGGMKPRGHQGTPPTRSHSGVGQYLNITGFNAQPLGLKPKDLCGIPWRVAFALQAEGWYLRQDIIWHKPNPMPESVTDRCTKSHEYVFLLSKSARYYYDADAIREPHKLSSLQRAKTPGNSRTRTKGASRAEESMNKSLEWGPEQVVLNPGGCNKRSVWTIPTQSFKQAHFATFPEALADPCIKAGTSLKGCCPKCGMCWERIVERDRKPTRPGKNNVSDDTGMANRDELRHVTETVTVGWRPGCGHKADPIPCVVLDPFFGAGTTGLVAAKHGRRFIGIELNPEYTDMARRRITDDAPLFNMA